MVVFVTVRPSLSLKEACGAQLHLTGSTHKVFRVPHFTQSCDHLQNREKKQVQWKREEVCICFIFFYYYYYSDFRTYNISMLVRLFNVPFPQCIYCRKHSGPWLWCVHQSSPSQSSALLAGHRQYLFSCSQSRPLHLNLLFCCRCCSRSPCCLVAHLLFFFSQTVSV